MTRWLLALAATLFISPAVAMPADQCENERASYPKNWKSVANEKLLLSCHGHYVRLKIYLTPGKDELLLTVVTDDKDVYRTHLTKARADRLKEQAGIYILNSEKTCFVRGGFNNPAVLSFIDNPGFNEWGFLFAKNDLNVIDDCETAK